MTPRSATELAEVIALERELQTSRARRDPTRLEELLAEGFSEVGASGRLWSRAETLALVAQEGDEVAPIEVGDITARHIGADAVLVSWRSDRAGRRAHRRSLWGRADGEWRLEHHQGTLTSDGTH